MFRLLFSMWCKYVFVEVFSSTIHLCFAQTLIVVITIRYSWHPYAMLSFAKYNVHCRHVQFYTQACTYYSCFKRWTQIDIECVTCSWFCCHYIITPDRFTICCLLPYYLQVKYLNDMNMHKKREKNNNFKLIYLTTNKFTLSCHLSRCDSNGLHE